MDDRRRYNERARDSRPPLHSGSAPTTPYYRDRYTDSHGRGFSPENSLSRKYDPRDDAWERHQDREWERDREHERDRERERDRYPLDTSGFRPSSSGYPTRYDDDLAGPSARNRRWPEPRRESNQARGGYERDRVRSWNSNDSRDGDRDRFPERPKQRDDFVPTRQSYGSSPPRNDRPGIRPVPGRLTVTEDASRYSRVPPPLGHSSPPLNPPKDLFRPDDRFRGGDRPDSNVPRPQEQRSYSPHTSPKRIRRSDTLMEARHLDDSRSEGQASQDSKDPFPRGAFSDGEEPRNPEPGYRSLLDRMEPRGSGAAVAKVLPFSAQMSQGDEVDRGQGTQNTPAAPSQPVRAEVEPYEKELGEISPEISKSAVREQSSMNRDSQSTAAENPQAADRLPRDIVQAQDEGVDKSASRPSESDQKVPAANQEKSASPLQAATGEEAEMKVESEQKQALQKHNTQDAVPSTPVSPEGEEEPTETEPPEIRAAAIQAAAETVDLQHTSSETSVPPLSTEDQALTSPTTETSPPSRGVGHENMTDTAVPLASPELAEETQPAMEHTDLPSLELKAVAETSHLLVLEPSFATVHLPSEVVMRTDLPADDVTISAEKQQSPTHIERLPSVPPEQPTITQVPASSPHVQPPLLSIGEAPVDMPDVFTGLENEPAHSQQLPSGTTSPRAVTVSTITEVQAATSPEPHAQEVPASISSGSPNELHTPSLVPVVAACFVQSAQLPIEEANHGDKMPEAEAALVPSAISAQNANLEDDFKTARGTVPDTQTVATETLPFAIASPHISVNDTSHHENRLELPTGLLQQDYGLPARTPELQDSHLQRPAPDNFPSDVTFTDGAIPAASTLVDPNLNVVMVTSSGDQVKLSTAAVPIEVEEAFDQAAKFDNPPNVTDANIVKSALTQSQPSRAKARYVDPETLRRRFERQAIIGRFDVIQYARDKGKELELKIERLQREYAKLDKEWDSHKSKMTAQNEEVTRQLDAISNPATVQEPKPGGRKTRRGFVEQDHELMGFRDGDEEALAKALKAIEQMMESDPTQRALKTEAIVPDMELDPDVWRLAYNDDNSLVLDPLTFYEHGKGEKPGDWTDDEERRFRKLYAAYPKQFGDIAKGLPGKTAAQCVKHYYLTKKKRPFKEGASKNTQRQASGGQSARMVAPVTHEKLELAGMLATGDRAQAKQVADTVRLSGESKKGKKKTDDVDRSGDSGSRADSQRVKKKASSKKRLLPSQDLSTPRDRSAASDASSAKKRKIQAKRPARLDLADGRAKSVANRSSSSRGPSTGPLTAESTAPAPRGPQQGVFLPDASGLPHRFIVNPPERPQSTPVVTWQDKQSQTGLDSHMMPIPDRSIRSTQTVPLENAPVARTGGLAIMSLLNDVPRAVLRNDHTSTNAASVASDATEDDGSHV